MTLSACRQPLEEVLKLWDFLLAFGVHLNVLAIVAQLLHLKDQLFESASPMKILRTLPDLEAQQIIRTTMDLVPQLPDDLYDLLVRHPTDPTILDVVLCEDD